jgi:hypothetical protein
MAAVDPELPFAWGILRDQLEELWRFWLNFDQVHRHLAVIDEKTGDRDRKREAARTSASRIHVQNTVLPSNSRLVGVAGDDSVESRRGRIEAEIFDVVEHIEERGPADLKYLRLRNRLNPGSLVDVSADGGDRRQASQFGHDLRIADVPCMDNEIATPQEAERLGAEEPMRIGN